MDRASNDTKHPTYSNKYVARLAIRLLLISAALFDRVESGGLIGQFIPASIYGHHIAIAIAVDLLLSGSGLSFCFSRVWLWAAMHGGPGVLRSAMPRKVCLH